MNIPNENNCYLIEVRVPFEYDWIVVFNAYHFQAMHTRERVRGGLAQITYEQGLRLMRRPKTAFIIENKCPA